MSPSPSGLAKRLAELEAEKRNEEKTKRLEAKQRQKDLGVAKKKIAKEIRSAQQELRKGEQLLGRLSQQAARVDQRSEIERMKKAQQLQKLDEGMQKLQNKRNAVSEELQKKMAAVGEARGKLAHIEITASLLKLGILPPVDYSIQSIGPGAQGCRSAQGDGSDAVSVSGITTNVPDAADASSMECPNLSTLSNQPNDTTKLTSRTSSQTSVNTATNGNVLATSLTGGAKDVVALDGGIRNIAIYVPQRLASTSSLAPSADAPETVTCNPMVTTEASCADLYTPIPPTSTSVPQRVAPSNDRSIIKDQGTMSKSLSMAAAFVGHDVLARANLDIAQKHEIVAPVSCRIQNAAYNRPMQTCSVGYRSPTPLCTGKELPAFKSYPNVSVATPRGQVIRQPSVDIKRCTRSASAFAIDARRTCMNSPATVFYEPLAASPPMATKVWS